MAKPEQTSDAAVRLPAWAIAAFYAPLGAAAGWVADDPFRWPCAVAGYGVAVVVGTTFVIWFLDALRGGRASIRQLAAVEIVGVGGGLVVGLVNVLPAAFLAGVLSLLGPDATARAVAGAVAGAALGAGIPRLARARQRAEARTTAS